MCLPPGASDDYSHLMSVDSSAQGEALMSVDTRTGASALGGAGAVGASTLAGETGATTAASKPQTTTKTMTRTTSTVEAPTRPADQAAMDALPGLRGHGESGRLLANGDYDVTAAGIATIVARDSGLSVSEALELDIAAIGRAMVEGRGFTDAQVTLLQSGLEAVPATIVALQTQAEVVSSIASTEGRLREGVAAFDQEGMTVAQGRARLEGLGISAQEASRILPGKLAAPLTTAARAGAREHLTTLQASASRLGETFGNPHYDIRTFNHDDRFAQTRDSVLLQAGVSPQDQDYRNSITRQGRPLDGRALMDDVFSVGGQALGLAGVAAEGAWKVTTAVLDMALYRTKTTDARVLHASGLVDQAHVQRADETPSDVLLGLAAHVSMARFLDKSTQFAVSATQRLLGPGDEMP